MVRDSLEATDEAGLSQKYVYTYFVQVDRIMYTMNLTRKTVTVIHQRDKKLRLRAICGIRRIGKLKY